MGLFVTDDGVPPSNCGIEESDQVYTQQHNLKIELRQGEDDILEFYINDDLIYQYEQITKMFPVEELTRYMESHYMENYDILEVLCERYISEWEDMMMNRLLRKLDTPELKD